METNNKNVDSPRDRYKDLFKKYNWVFWMLLSIAILIPYWISDYKTIKKGARYAIGTTTKSYVAKGYRKQTNYYFYWGNKKIEASHAELNFRAKDIKVPDGKYLVIYAVRDPKICILLVDRPVQENTNLDSLNRAGVNPDDFDWWDL